MFYEAPKFAESTEEAVAKFLAEGGAISVAPSRRKNRGKLTETFRNERLTSY